MSEEINQTPLAGKKMEGNLDNTIEEGQEHEAFFKKVGQWKVPQYANIFFDSLYSEYRALEAEAEDENLKKNLDALSPRLEDIKRKREQSALNWNDVYEFDLALLRIMPAKDLVRKAYDMRAKYRSIAGAKDYDAYIASKPPDLTTVDSHAQDDSPEAPVVTVEALRADTRYLLKQFYLHYAFLPYREGFRDELTKRARNMTFYILTVIVLLGAFEFIIARYFEWSKYGSVVAVVIFAGVIGGCVSMLQRIQSAPSEGDALYNLAGLSYGWKGISLSPLYGGIFATLLFILFSAGLLKGTIFPEIKTFQSIEAASQKNSESAQTSSNSNNATDNRTDQTSGNNNNSNAGQNTSAAQATTSAAQATPTASISPQSSPSPQSSASPQSSPTPTPEGATSSRDSSSITFRRFLTETYPKDGVSYALLVVWSFIAGFAERLVPDTLNRLVTKNESIQGTGS